MKLWLDDIRNPAQTYDPQDERCNMWSGPDVVWVKTAKNAIEQLQTGQVTHISLDHDLGYPLDEVGTGYLVACWIEEHAANGALPPIKWAVHSANPVGVRKMKSALTSADRFWSS